MHTIPAKQFLLPATFGRVSREHNSRLEFVIQDMTLPAIRSRHCIQW